MKDYIRNMQVANIWKCTLFKLSKKRVSFLNIFRLRWTCKTIVKEICYCFVHKIKKKDEVEGYLFCVFWYWRIHELMIIWIIGRKFWNVDIFSFCLYTFCFDCFEIFRINSRLVWREIGRWLFAFSFSFLCPFLLVNSRCQ